MRILHVTPHYYPSIGGVERHLHNISQKLVQLGHEVVIATTRTDKKLPIFEEINGVQIKRFSAYGLSVYKIPVGITRYLIRESSNFDIIHAHNYHALPFLITLITARNCFISPYYHTKSHSKTADLLHKLYSPIIKRLIRAAKPKVINLSVGESQEFKEKFDISEEDITIIPSGTTLPKQNLSFSKEEGLILSVGRLEKYKNVDKLIQAMKHLPEAFSLFIIGTGSQRDSLEEISDRLGLGSRVHFLGKIASDEEVAKWYSSAQVFVSLSEAESFGITLLEAIAFQCKVVCSHIPAFSALAKDFPEIIFTASPDSSPEMIAQIVQQASSSTESSTANLKKYLWPNIAAQYLDTYQKHLQTQDEEKQGQQ